MSTWARLRAQVRSDLLVYLRTPAALFFNALLPIIFLVLFVAIFGNETDESSGVRVATFQVPGFIALAVTSASFLGLAISLVSAREDGILKRVRGTPAPTWLILAGRIGVGVVTAIVVTVVLLVIARVFYDVSLPLRTAPALLVCVLVGAFALSALGIAFTRVIGSEDTAPALTNVVVLPLYFISGVFVPSSQLPDGLNTIAGIFPIKSFNDALFACFDPRTEGAGLAWGDLGVVVVWGIVGTLIALGTFRWVPAREAE